MARRSPRFAITGILVLALGGGCNTGIFGLINALMPRPLRFPEPGQLAMLAVLINEVAAKPFFHSPAEALGDRLSGSNCKSCQIVGVVRNVRNFVLKNDAAAELYVGLSQLPCPVLDVAFRTHSDPVSLVPAVPAAILAIASGIAIDRIRTMEDVLAGHTAQPRFNAILLGLFAGVGMLLAAAGVFGGAAAWASSGHGRSACEWRWEHKSGMGL